MAEGLPALSMADRHPRADSDDENDEGGLRAERHSIRRRPLPRQAMD